MFLKTVEGKWLNVLGADVIVRNDSNEWTRYVLR
jgi:hypothetical protein